MEEVGIVAALWAKTLRNAAVESTNQPYHPLLYHLLDVAAVADAMWGGVLPPATRAAVAHGLGVSESSARWWVVFLAGMHDIGKASPVFQHQTKDGAITGRLQKAGFAPLGHANPIRHGPVSAVILEEQLPALFNISHRDVVRKLAVAVGGHHGIFPRDTANETHKEARGKGMTHQPYRDAQALLAQTLAALLDGVPEERPTRCDNATAITLAGLVSVADWIGSIDEATAFPFAPPPTGDDWLLTAKQYRDAAHERAEAVLRRLGWFAGREGVRVSEARVWERIFEYTPNAMQKIVVAQIGGLLTAPGLVIVEAPMGQGKTEAALYLAEHAAAAQGLDGMYVALPTMATGNAMFRRVRDYLEGRFGGTGDRANTQLLHGRADLVEEFALLRKEADALFMPEPGSVGSDEGDMPAVIAAGWFTGRRRGLLAPYGVGTVDQVLLAALQTKHVFVRLFGLAHKVVIVDEVHAYDTYMTTLMERLLEWLAALGCTVILLSATLPRGRRESLVRAYASGAGATSVVLPPANYPRITGWVVGDTAATVLPIPVTPADAKHVHVEPLSGPLLTEDGRADALVAELRERLTDGGCAAVICNTVRRAQDVYRALRDSRMFAADELRLLHSRFRFKERDAKEQDVLALFGKSGEGQRPRRVLVATQIVEQSLDLDFDLMVSDLAPADLVLQRIGRLHRHERGARPAAVQTPVLLLAPPADGIGEDGVPRFGVSRFVYDAHVLLRSWLALKDRTEFRIPQDIEEIIGRVYTDNLSCPEPWLQEVWDATLRKQAEDAGRERDEAAKRYVKRSQYGQDFATIAGSDALGDDDDPTLHQQVQALTRLTEETQPLVLLLPEDARTIGVPSRPSLGEARALLRCAVNVTGWGNVRWVREHAATPAGWAKSPHLRHHVLLRAEHLRDGVGAVTADGRQLIYDTTVGLMFPKEIEEAESGTI